MNGAAISFTSKRHTTTDDSTTAAELTAILMKLNISARELLRSKEEEYRSLQLNNLALSEQQLINTMVAHPKLIERPIVVKGDRAAIGRPLSNISALL